MDIHILRGAEANLLLRDDAFRRDWDALCARCPWATAYQGPGFVLTWYEVYRDRYDPVAVVARDGGGGLVGLLTLAVSAREHRLGAAGLWQAEYHAWISDAERGDEFARLALRAVRRAFPGMSLRFQYLAHGAPLGWLVGPGADVEAARTCLLKSTSRPLLQFGDGEQIRASLKKRGNKSRLRRLARLGPVEFRHVTDPDEFDRGFDNLARIYDARQLAVNGLAPFENDPQKRAFHLAMMRVPGLLHTTLLTVGDRVASAQVNVLDRAHQAHLGLIAHDPLLSAYSPGKFHILMLARMLFEAGYVQLDLTPGGDAYKQRFANAWDDVHTLTVLPSFAARARTLLVDRVFDLAKRTLTRLDVRPAHAEATFRRFTQLERRGDRVRLARHLVWGAAARTASRVAARRVTQLYRCDAQEAARYPSPIVLRHNALNDLSAYVESSVVAPSKHEFLASTFQRVERGMHVYTSVHDGRLSHVAWVIEPVGAAEPGGEQQSNAGDGADPIAPEACGLPPGSVLVCDVQVVGNGDVAALLQSVIFAAAQLDGAKGVYVAVPRGDRALACAVEALGLALDRSVRERRILGRHRRRIVDADNNEMVQGGHDIDAIGTPARDTAENEPQPVASGDRPAAARKDVNRASRRKPTHAAAEG